MWREEPDENAAVRAAFEIVCSCSLYALVIHQIKPCAKLEYTQGRVGDRRRTCSRAPHDTTD
jgi:hypothetical protein